MNSRLRPVVDSSAIYKDLLKKIIDLTYEPGEGISENELCEKYDTTRHSVRGALAILKEKGLVEVYPQRGTYVSLIDLKMIDDILFLRSAIEQETLHVIIEKDDNTRLIRELRECLERQTEAADSGNVADFYKIDDEFHSRLFAAAGRSSVQSLYEDAYLHVRRWRNLEVGKQSRMRSLPLEHKEIIDAIENKDEIRARKLIIAHIDSVSLYGGEMKAKHSQFFV